MKTLFRVKTLVGHKAFLGYKAFTGCKALSGYKTSNTESLYTEKESARVKASSQKRVVSRKPFGPQGPYGLQRPSSAHGSSQRESVSQGPSGLQSLLAQKGQKKVKAPAQKDFGLRRPGAEPLTLYRGPKQFTGAQKTPQHFDAKLLLQVTQNNTIGSISTLARGCLYTTSSGAQGFRGARRGTSAAFFAVGVALAEKAQRLGFYRVQVHTQGMSKFRVNLLRGLLWGGLTLVSLHEVSLRPHNGCRPPAIRRL